MSVKINTLEIENVKRIKAVQFEPTKNGLTVIGGRNRQGKTSVLDSIAWALGGEKYRPSQPKREGSFAEPHLKLTLDNGIVVERGGKNGSLKVTDSTGKKGGQQLLNSFVEQFALDLPRFMNQSAKDKAATLLRIIGVEQLIVATSIVRKLSPECGFVLLDKLEQMDTDTLAEFGKWLEEQGLQAIATRVSTGGECSVIIEDGTSFTPETQQTNTVKETGFKWNGGKF